MDGVYFNFTYYSDWNYEKNVKELGFGGFPDLIFIIFHQKIFY